MSYCDVPVMIKKSHRSHGWSYLQADDVASLPELLWRKASLLFVRVLHPYVTLTLETFEFGLRDAEVWRDREENGGGTKSFL